MDAPVDFPGPAAHGQEVPGQIGAQRAVRIACPVGRPPVRVPGAATTTPGERMDAPLWRSSAPRDSL
jgi:hypothetical protein